MRILFIGTVEFSFKALEKLIDINADVVGVCTKETSPFNSDFSDLSPLCIKHEIPYKYVNDINSEENISWIRAMNPDVIFCFGWSSLIKLEMLNLAPMGVVGFHPANLPKNRGRHPLIWALVQGLKESASTFFFMEEGADDGDILSQEMFNISYEDDARTLYEKVITIALKQITDFVPQLENDTYLRTRQDHRVANTWRKRGKSDGEIDFRMNGFAIYNLVRGLTTPYVGAHIEYLGEDVIIWEVAEVDDASSNIESGKVLESYENTILVKCYDKAIRILKHEFKILPKVGEYI